MLADLVLDTNVWAHADNPTEPRQAEAIACIEKLLSVATLLCVDDGFSLIESQNRSRIGSEYIAHLAALPFASASLAAMAGSGRVSFTSTRVPDRVRRKINVYVGDPSDRVFARVAHNSKTGVLCSHDYRHFPLGARAKLKSCHVDILSASEATDRM